MANGLVGSWLFSSMSSQLECCPKREFLPFSSRVRESDVAMEAEMEEGSVFGVDAMVG